MYEESALRNQTTTPTSAAKPIGWLFLIWLGLHLCGCLAYLQIPSSRYRIADFKGSVKGISGPLQGVRLVLDRNTKKATITRPDGTQVSFGIEQQPRAKWVKGCDDKGKTRLEVLKLKTETLILGTFTFRQPILQLRECDTKAGLFLREANQINNLTRWQCTSAEMCIVFR